MWKTIGIIVSASIATIALGQDAEPRPVDQVRADARAVAGLVDSELGASFLRASEDLPEIEGERIVYWDRATRRALTEEEAVALDEESLSAFEKREYGESFYYNTAYGTPVAYCRAIDLAGQHGLTSADGKRILDFGFGGIGHLRMLASLGADCVGLDVLELLEKFYTEPGDTGPVARAATAGPGEPGSITLLYGEYPKDGAIAEAVGGGYDLIVSKNTLKKGYIHPEREAEPRFLIDLGVSDEAYLRAMYDALNPGGLFVVYNIYPKQAPPEERYIPWATGGFPFELGLTEEVGFEVIGWDVEDSAAMREMAEALGWSARMDLGSVFGMYTIVRKPGG